MYTYMYMQKEKEKDSEKERASQLGYRPPQKHGSPDPASAWGDALDE